jgi:hypothetical protein
MGALKAVIIKLGVIHLQFQVYQQTSQLILKLKNIIKNQIFLLYKIRRLWHHKGNQLQNNKKYLHN